MKVAVTADFHGHLPPNGFVRPCDLLILAGDVLPHQLAGLDELAGWLRRQPAEVIVGVAGNHDFIAEDHPDEVRELPWTYLQDEATTVEFANGEHVKVWGSPRSTKFNDWAFMGDEPDLEKVWAKIPDDTEILITHGPAYGLLDTTVTGKSVGSPTLRERIRELHDLRLFAFGHIHESYGITGMTTVRPDGVEQVIVINGAYVNHRYVPGNVPITYTLDAVANAT